MEINHTFEEPLGQRRNQKGNKNNLETKDNGNTMYYNLWDAAKKVLKENIIAMKVNIKIEERSQINNLDYTVN